ncbi:protein of unknown function [Streptomyces sp. KY75]|nr:protein of unknown function [Streptomyces sp. KY70]CAD5988071.1 protein of unknown function [Streptomyces sp. KY75]
MSAALSGGFGEGAGGRHREHLYV